MTRMTDERWAYINEWIADDMRFGFVTPHAAGVILEMRAELKRLRTRFTVESQDTPAVEIPGVWEQGETAMAWVHIAQACDLDACEGQGHNQMARSLHAALDSLRVVSHLVRAARVWRKAYHAGKGESDGDFIQARVALNYECSALDIEIARIANEKAGLVATGEGE